MRRLWADRRGAIAPMAAVCITGLIVTTGAAVDIGRLVAAQSSLQDSVDSANLALARMPQSATPADLQAKAQAWILANATNGDLTNIVVATPTRTLGQVQLDVTAKINTTLASLLGVTSLPVEGHSIVKYGTTHVELALVLDNTGSMNDDNKLTSLKSAATTLVNTLSASAQASNDPNALKVAVVPFSMAVNIGNQYQQGSSTWLTGKAPAAYNDVNTGGKDRFTLFSQLGQTWGGCVEDRPMPYDVQETAPTTTIPATMFVPFFSPDEPDTSSYKNWPNNGNNTCIGSNYTPNGSCQARSYYSVNNYLNETPNTDYNSAEKDTSKYNSSNLWPASGNGYWTNNAGPNAGCTVQPLQRLTTNTTTVLNQISSMVAGGDTEIPLGLVWGWHVLSPLSPFADGTPYGAANTIKVIVLVTDGANTYGYLPNPNGSAYTALGYASQNRISSSGTAAGTASALNDRLAQLCSNMKTKNADGSWKINIYTVPLEVTDTNIKGLLQGCVTDPANYLDVSSSSGLADAFANIAGSISALRVAH